MGVLTAILADAGGVALDVARIFGRVIERGSKQQRQLLITAHKIFVYGGHGP